MSMKGREQLRDYLLRQAPEKLRAIAKGAARAGGNVIRDDARERCRSGDVRDKIATRVTQPSELEVKVTVAVRGNAWARSVANWLEYGTSPHFISVDPELSGGRTPGRVNRQEKAGDLDIGGPRRVNEGELGSIVINGKFVGITVHHPGARPEPFLRPAYDMSLKPALAAAQAYIDRRGAGGHATDDD